MNGDEHAPLSADERRAADGLPILVLLTVQAWEAWLERDHAGSSGVWLAIPKKGGGETGLSYAEALDVALCFGWIDGQKGKLDERFWLQRFTPRRPRSPWSRVNREKALALIERGTMRPAGLREVELARGDGRWEAAYEPQSAASVPNDLRAALDANPAAAAAFAGLNGANRYAILHRLHAAKKPETRARRLASFIEMLAEGRTLYP
jgi:uncharacterized protein YdeI (YjbR/CyaY-like superfamily)